MGGMDRLTWDKWAAMGCRGVQESVDQVPHYSTPDDLLALKGIQVQHASCAQVFPQRPADA